MSDFDSQFLPRVRFLFGTIFQKIDSEEKFAFKKPGFYSLSHRKNLKLCILVHFLKGHKSEALIWLEKSEFESNYFQRFEISIFL